MDRKLIALIDHVLAHGLQVHVHSHGDTQILTALHTLQEGLDRLMADAQTMQASLVALGKALDNIAADIAGLKGKIGTGMSQADVDTAQAALDKIGAQAQALADSTPDEVPPAAV